MQDIVDIVNYLNHRLLPPLNPPASVFSAALTISEYSIEVPN